MTRHYCVGCGATVVYNGRPPGWRKAGWLRRGLICARCVAVAAHRP